MAQLGHAQEQSSGAATQIQQPSRWREEFLGETQVVLQKRCSGETGVVIPSESMIGDICQDAVRSSGRKFPVRKRVHDRKSRNLGNLGLPLRQILPEYDRTTRKKCVKIIRDRTEAARAAPGTTATGVGIDYPPR